MARRSVLERYDRRSRRRRALGRVLAALVLLFSSVLVLRAGVIVPVRIPDSAMEPRLMRGDLVLASPLSWGIRIPLLRPWLLRWTTPRPGEIVVLTDPEASRWSAAGVHIAGLLPRSPGPELYVRELAGMNADEVRVRSLQPGYLDSETFGSAVEPADVMYSVFYRVLPLDRFGPLDRAPR